MSNPSPGDETIPDPAEATDSTVLGEDGQSDVLPGTVGFPPTEPTGVGPEDTLSDAEHHDSVAERSQRETSETVEPDDEAIRLMDPDGGGTLDDEAQAIGEAGDASDLVSPEEAAMHVDDPS